MNHFMLDCYGCNPILLSNINYINKVMNEIPYELGLSTVTPASLVPYYYGKVKEDDGISSFLFLEGGHITLHTFPERKCYFLDIYAEQDINFEVLDTYLSKYLPYDKNISTVSSKDRKEQIFCNLPYEPKQDFGPHVLTEIECKNPISMERIYDFLEGLVVKIGMTPIIRPNVIKSKINNPKYISGIIMIAESHISIHYNIETNVIFSDIFSCCPFDFSGMTKIFNELGEVKSYEVVPRGTKHYSKVANYHKDIVNIACEKWKNNIY